MQTKNKSHSTTKNRTRAYQESHPWITFKIDLRDISYKTWLLLGEAQSKCEHISYAPLLPDVAEEVHQVYLAKGVLATTAIEGNTLTEAQVRQLMDNELELPPSKEYLGQEVENVLEGCNLILSRIIREQKDNVCVEDLKTYNQIILQNLPYAADMSPGDIRDHNVTVGRYPGAPYQDCEYLLQELCDWLNSNWNTLSSYKIAFGIIKAIAAHVYLVWIHPFADGNGRTARLLELQILLSVGVPSAAAHLLSNHYNQTRTEYYRYLDIAHRTGGNLLPFIEYSLQGFVDGLVEQIQRIQAQQLEVHWINHIYNRFRNKDTQKSIRQRKLILDLSRHSEPIPTADIAHISPRIAEAYAEKTDRTVTRDLRELTNMGLIRREPEGWVARREQVLSMLPAKRPHVE